MSTRLVFLDFSSLARPIWEAPSTNADTDHKSQQMVARVRALASGQPHFVICCDSGRSFRKDLDPTYKAQRPEVDASYKHQVALALETLTADGFPVWAVPGMEADDIIASAVTWAVSRPNEHQSVIASSDKDLFQLIGPRVSVHRLADTKKAIQVDEAAFRAEFGIEPNQMRDYLCLVGDASDNIKGADGIGPKKAAAMLQKYGNLEDLYAALDQHGTQFTPSTATSLREFQPRMAAVRALVSLRTDVVLPFEEVFRERVARDVATFGIEAEMETEDVQPQVPLPDETPAPTVAAPIPEPLPLRPNGGDSGRAAEPAAPQSKPAMTADPFADLMQRAAKVDYDKALEPRTLPEAITLAKHMHDSRLFSAYGTPQAVLATIMAGREFGLQAMAALRGFHVIDGKQVMSADLIRAVTQRAPMCEYFRCIERTATAATWVTKRKGDPELSLRFTVEEGRAAFAGDDTKWSKSGWGKNPADMCVARASAKLARLVYADVVFNIYAPEEME